MATAAASASASASTARCPRVRHDGSVRVMVVGDRGDDDPGFVGERLVELGATLVLLDRDALPDSDALDAADLLLLLCSARSAALPDPVLCPPGPWLQYHSDTFTEPPGVRVLGTSPSGCQGFSYERGGARALGWQFHPETTPSELARWLDNSRDWVLEHGGDPARITAQAADRAAATRVAAYDLTDAALHWLGVGP